jgi:hypothetical protein
MLLQQIGMSCYPVPCGPIGLFTKLQHKHSPSKLMCGLLLLLPTIFLVLLNQITTKRNENLENA